MPLTPEQIDIIGCDPKEFDILKVIAFAGTGKTSTLFEYTKERPHLKFLNISFNKSVRIEAERKFPSNVTCKTSHALGFAKLADEQKSRLDHSGLKANIIKNYLDIEKYTDAQFVIDTLKNYMISADNDISHKHLSPSVKRLYSDNQKPPIDYIYYAKELWSAVCSGKEPSIPMVHDCYLKLYQLSKPKLPYDCILLDEAQDTNPVVSDFIFSQSCPKILVGDPHQQIYSFRGAQDAMQKIESTKTKYLTNSFRFGENIAWIANRILELFKNEKKKLVGVGKSISNENFYSKYAVIARTNATLFDRAVDALGNKKISFCGGIEGYNLESLKDAYYLFSEQHSLIKAPFVKSFDSFQKYKEFAEKTEDWEIFGKCKFVEKYETRTPILVDRIVESATTIDKAEIILATAHKAKGAQFGCVELADDFPELIEKENVINREITKDEANLLYVACTRAEENLRVPFSWKDFVTYERKEKYMQVLQYLGFLEREEKNDLDSSSNLVPPKPPNLNNQQTPPTTPNAPSKYWVSTNNGTSPAVLMHKDVAVEEAKKDPTAYFMTEDQSSGWRRADYFGLLNVSINGTMINQTSSPPNSSKPSVLSNPYQTNYRVSFDNGTQPVRIFPRIYAIEAALKDPTAYFMTEDQSSGWQRAEYFGLVQDIINFEVDENNIDKIISLINNNCSYNMEIYIGKELQLRTCENCNNFSLFQIADYWIEADECSFGSFVFFICENCLFTYSDESNRFDSIASVPKKERLKLFSGLNNEKIDICPKCTNKSLVMCDDGKSYGIGTVHICYNCSYEINNQLNICPKCSQKKFIKFNDGSSRCQNCLVSYKDEEDEWRQRIYDEEYYSKRRLF